MQEPLALLDGRWIPASEAAVPVGDAGFVLGATVTEQLRTFAGKLFHLDDHLARLAQSLEIVGVDAGMTPARFAQAAEELVAHNHRLLAPGDDLGLSIFVTPGEYPAYSACEKAGAGASPTVCLHTYPLPFGLWAAKYRDGQPLVTTEVEQVSSRCWPAGLKCRSRMHYYLADRRAAEIDPQARALMLDHRGFVAETSTANLLIYNAASGLASPPAAGILRGISLTAAVQLARRFKIECGERPLTVEDVAGADEALLTSTPLCLLPVVSLNGRPIGAGRPGEMFRRLIAAWSELVGIDIVGQAERFAGSRK